MGSLEEKVTRLSPEQRSEAEMFIDFLLMKSASASPGPAQDPFPGSDHSIPASRPIIMAEEIHARPVTTRPNDTLPSLGDLKPQDTHPKDERVSQPSRSKPKDPGLLLDWID